MRGLSGRLTGRESANLILVVCADLVRDGYFPSDAESWTVTIESSEGSIPAVIERLYLRESSASLEESFRSWRASRSSMRCITGLRFVHFLFCFGLPGSN